MSKNLKTRPFDIRNYEERGISLEDVKQIKEAFDLFDNDKSGSIDSKELKEALKNIGLTTENATLNNIMESLDADHSGTVDFDEFFDLLSSKATIGESEADLKKVFELFTGNKSDYIDFDTLKQISKELSDLFDQGDVSFYNNFFVRNNLFSYAFDQKIIIQQECCQ